MLRGLQHETPFARRRFFEQIGGCRRRAVGDWAERPIAVALTVPSEFEIMVQRIRAVRLRETISGRGLGVQEAFERFDLQQVGFLGPIEICQALRHLGFHTSPDEILDWLEAMDESGDHVVSYREFFSFVKHKVDGFMGGDHAIVTELGEKQISLGVPGPPALDRAVSGSTGDAPGNLGVPPALTRATSDSRNALTVGRPPSMKREISRKPELSQGERDTISNRLQDRIARRKLEEEKEKEHIAVEEEEMQIAIEEQHGANPLYTYANVSCGGATTADFDFQMDYLPKDCFAFGFVEPVSVEGGKGFLQVDKRSFVQVTKLQLPPNGGSNKKLNIYGLTMSFCCPSLPQSEPGGGAVSVVRVNIHYAIADVYFVYAGKEKGDQKAYTHEFKLEPGENITDVTVKSVEGVGVYSLVFKTTQGRTSETFEGDEMEYLDSDDLTRKNWSAGRGNMIAGLKTKVTDGVVSITGITKKPVNQSGKTEQPSDRLTLVSLSRAPGDADSYEQVVGGTGTQAGPEASESFVGCEIFVWKDGTIAPDGFQAPEQRLPTVDDSVLQGRWEITFEGDPPPGAEGYVWQVTLSVDAAGRIQGDGHPIKRKKPILHGRKTSTAAVEVKEAEATVDMAEVEMPELDREETEDMPEVKMKKKKQRRPRPDSEDEEECEEESDPGDEPDFDEEPEEEIRLNRGETDDCSDVNSDERPEVDRSTLSEELVPMYDCVVELTELLENYNGDLGQVLRSYKQLFEHFRKIRAAKKLRREFENCGLEHKFDFLHDLLCEHDLEEELSDFFEELYGEDYDSEYDSSDDGEDEEPEEKAEKKPEKKAIKIVALRSEGKLVGRQVTLDLFGDQKKSAAEKKKREEDEEDEEEEEQPPTTVQFCFDGAVVDESETTALLKGEWRAANPNDDDPELEGLKMVTEGRWSAMRVVDESVRLAGPWRVSVGLQDGAQAYAFTMWLTVHFAVESRSGAVNGVLLEGPDLEDATSREGPKVSNAIVEGSLSSRSLRLQVNGWKGRAMLEGQLDRKGGAVASITGFWWSLDANEISGTWSASRLDGTVLEKLIEPKLTGEEPLVSKCNAGCRLTASGLKNKGKPMCSSKHVLTSKKGTDDDDEEGLECERCGREVNGAHWWCNRCDVAVCSRCEKQTVAKEVEDEERRQFEVAALDRFKLAGKVYFEVTVEKVGDGALIGLALQNVDDDYAPGEDLGTFALMHNGVCRHNGKDEGKSAVWKDGAVISFAVDCDAGTVQVATLDKPAFETVLQLAAEEMPAEVGMPFIALLSPGDKGAMTVNVGQQPFKLQPPAKAFHPLAELMELRRQWRVTLPDNVETWPVYVKPSRQAEGSESLQAQWGFEELGTLPDENGVKWIRHSGGWSPVSLEALGRLCTGLTPLPSTIDALEKRGDANGFKFFRFVVTKARGGDTVNGVSLGQLLLRREGMELDLADATAENPDGQFAETEGPGNAIDGRTSTRWHSTVLSPLVIKLPKPVLIDSFSFRTGPSDEQLDPVEWRLEASNDQNTWKVLHSQETSYHPPRRRCGQASWFDTSTRGSGSSGKSKLVPWTSGVKILAGHWHALTLAVDLPNSKMTIWVDGEVALEICDPSSPLLRCDGPLSLDPQEGMCLFGRKPFLKKEWSWMLGAQIKGLQLQTSSPDLFNTWALQMPLGVWICRAQGTCKANGLFTRNSASLGSCWRCKSNRIKSGFRPPNDADPRHPGIKIFTTDSFEELLEKDKCVFLAVSADWCGACQQMKPAWFALAKLLKNSKDVTVGVMNIDENEVDRRYFPERHIPVVKLLKKLPQSDDFEQNDKPVVISYEGHHHLPGWLEFLSEHTELKLQEILDSNYEAYVKDFGIQGLTTDLTAAARKALKEYWGTDSALAGSGAGGWRRLCAFLCNYCWDPELSREAPTEATLQKKVSVSSEKEPGEDELWIRLLLKRTGEEVEKALRSGHPRKPLDYLLKEVFLPGSKPDDLQMVRTGIHAEELLAVTRGSSGEAPRTAAQQWSAVEQQKAAARAEPMALPMLQRSWAKIKQAIDSKNAKRMQTIQELLTRGLDLDFNALGREQASVLWLAAANNDLEVLQFCLAYGADPHRDTEGVLPTEAAAATGALQALAMLLRIGAVPGRALHFAAATSQVGALRVLINSKADLRVRVNGLTPLAVAVCRDNDEVIKLLLQQSTTEPSLGSAACEALGLAAGSNLLYLAAQCGLDRTCDLLIQKGVRPNLEAPRAVGTQSVQENVRAVLEPHRWTILRRMCPEGKATNQLHVVIKEAMDECNADGEKKLAVCSGVGVLRPTTMAALLDDAEAIKLLAKVDLSGDLVPASSPSLLMWAQWAASQQAARVMLDAGVTLSNTDLEGLRRLGRARRQSQDGAETASAAARLLEPGNWSLLPQALQQLAGATPMSRLQELREKMLVGINDVAQVEEEKPPVLAQLPSQPPLLTRVTSTQVEQEEASAKEEVAASTLLDMLGPERTSLMRFLVQREIARGEGKSGLSPKYLLALHASSIYVDIHAQSQRFMVLLKAALNTLPSARGPCYRAIMGSELAPVTSLKHYSPGSIIRWPFGACGTLDFSSAMTCLTQQLSGGESRGYRGVIFKVRRLLTAKEVDESNRQVLFTGGAMRVVGIFPLNGPLLAAERELSVQSKPLVQRMGHFCPSLDMVRRPETAQPWEVQEQPLVMVLLDEEEE